MVRVVNDLLCSSDSGHVSILAMLDLSAAFDTLDNEILFDRFATTFGCSGYVLRWFRSYLSERNQSIVIDEFVLAPSTLKYGVPQGSILGTSDVCYVRVSTRPDHQTFRNFLSFLC